MPLSPADEALSDAAEEVRAYLVAIRGGAPFLSAADGRLLVGWLREGVPVPLVLTCIDRVATKRRKRKARSRLTLARCRKEVETVWGSKDEAPATPLVPTRGPAAALERWASEVRERPLESALRPARDQLLDRVTDLLQGPPMGAETTATEVIAACRQFHADAWDAATDRESLLDAARTELAALEAQLGDRVFLDLVEEGARARLRARTPLLSAEEVWDRLAGTDFDGGSQP